MAAVPIGAASEFVKESDSRFQIEYSMNGSNYPHWVSIHS